MKRSVPMPVCGRSYRRRNFVLITFFSPLVVIVIAVRRRDEVVVLRSGLVFQWNLLQQFVTCLFPRRFMRGDAHLFTVLCAISNRTGVRWYTIFRETTPTFVRLKKTELPPFSNKKFFLQKKIRQKSEKSLPRNKDSTVLIWAVSQAVSQSVTNF